MSGDLPLVERSFYLRNDDVAIAPAYSAPIQICTWRVSERRLGTILHSLRELLKGENGETLNKSNGKVFPQALIF